MLVAGFTAESLLRLSETELPDDCVDIVEWRGVLRLATASEKAWCCGSDSLANDCARVKGGEAAGEGLVLAGADADAHEAPGWSLFILQTRVK